MPEATEVKQTGSYKGNNCPRSLSYSYTQL